MTPSSLCCGDQEGGLGRVALDLPVAVVLGELGVVGQEPPPSTTRASSSSGRVRASRAVVQDAALGRVADAGELDLARGGDHAAMVISLRVSVPVLSEQITDAEPSVSTECSFFTTALRWAMRCTPIASTTREDGRQTLGHGGDGQRHAQQQDVTSPLSVGTPLTQDDRDHHHDGDRRSR